MTHPREVRFGDFTANLRTGELFCSGARVHLQEQPFRLLQMLLENGRELTTRDQIQQVLWPESQVGDFDHAINVATKKLRDTLGDNAETPRYIETVSRRGYRFIAPVEEVSPPAAAHTEPISRQERQTKHWPALRIVLLTIAVAAIATATYRVQRREPPPINSLAVLPLANLSGDPGQEYLADGVTDELITAVAKIGSLKVISRTSVMRFKNTTLPLKQVAQQLGVDAVLEGSVQRRGDRVRINAQLIHAASDTHLWANSFDGQLSDTLTLTSSITRSIAEQVRAKLTAEERQQLAQNVPVIPAAYQDYLQGRYFFERRQYEKAAEHFQNAVAKDPNYVAGWYGLSEARSMSSYIRGGSGIDTTPARERLMKLAPASAEAHLLAGDDRFYGAWHWDACETEFHRAVELAPRSLDAIQHYAGCLAVLGRVDESARQWELARNLDPLSPEVWQAMGSLYYRAHQPRRAIAFFRQTLQLDPRPSLYLDLGLAYDDDGDVTAAREAYSTYLRLADLDAEERKVEEQVLRAEGNAAFLRRRAQFRLGELKRAGKVADVPAMRFANAFANLGQADEAFQYAEKAYNERDPHLPWVKTSRIWDPLRSDPRFAALMRRMNLE